MTKAQRKTKRAVAMTVFEAARHLRVSTQTVHNWIGLGLLEEVPVEGYIHLVSIRSVERLAYARAGKKDPRAQDDEPTTPRPR